MDTSLSVPCSGDYPCSVSGFVRRTFTEIEKIRAVGVQKACAFSCEIKEKGLSHQKQPYPMAGIHALHGIAAIVF